MREPELRFDPFTEGWVVVAPLRKGIGGMRPAGLPQPAGERCPFCPGHEADTEETVLALGDPWRVRVVANRYPLVREDAPEPDRDRGSFDSRAARGAHEVVIESPVHDDDLATLAPDHALSVLLAWRERLRALERRRDVRSVVLFRNRGRRAGSSQPHPHSQIVALPIVPPAVELRARIAAKEAHGSETLLMRVLTDERRAASRIVLDEDGFVTWCPFAPSRAHETRIAPSFECHRFSALSDAELAVLARRLVALVAGLLRVTGATDYNVLLRDPPVRGVPHRASFFTLDVLPRTGGDAGFELCSGSPVAVARPEDTASLLRT